MPRGVDWLLVAWSTWEGFRGKVEMSCAAPLPKWTSGSCEQRGSESIRLSLSPGSLPSLLPPILRPSILPPCLSHPQPTSRVPCTPGFCPSTDLYYLIYFPPNPGRQKPRGATHSGAHAAAAATGQLPSQPGIFTALGRRKVMECSGLNWE